MDFTVVDGVVAVLIILSAILAYSRGLVRELMAIVGWIGAAVLGYYFAAQAQPLVKEIPVIGDFLRDSCELSIIAAFAAVFSIGLVLAALFTPLLSSAVQRSALGGIDQALGFLFGVIRGVVLVVIAFVVFDRAVPEGTVIMVDSSRTQKVVANIQGRVNDAIPTSAPEWILTRYHQLTDVCEPQKTDETTDETPTVPTTDSTPSP